MRKALRAILTKLPDDGRTYGPRHTNPAYLITSAKGVQYRVSRHQWTLPSVAWGWKAQPLPDKALAGTVFGDTLIDIAYKLGVLTADMEPK